MTEKEKLRHLAARKKRAEEIMAKVANFKVCDQCRSISYKTAQACSVCGAYRFNEDPEVVKKTAQEMGMHAFPTTSATVPRVVSE